MSMKRCLVDSPKENQILDSNGAIKTAWLNLFAKYPDRFMISSDQFFVAPGITKKFHPHFNEAWDIAEQLPEDLRAKIAAENPASVFGL